MDINQKLKGICPIVAAPFTDSGEVDYHGLENLVSFLCGRGCNGLTLFGIASEYYKLTDAERNKMAEITVKICKDRGVLSIISVTDHSTENAVVSAKRYEKMGADCLMLLPPFFLKPSARDIENHIERVVSGVNIPVIVQYAPEQTGVAIPVETFGKLSEKYRNVHFKIECKPAGPYISALRKVIRTDSRILVGYAGLQIIEALDRGADGAMPGCSMAEIYQDVYSRYASGDRDGAIAVHNLLLPMLNHIFQSIEQIIYYEKLILKKRRIIESDYCRLPTFVPDDYFDRIFEERYAPLADKYKF